MRNGSQDDSALTRLYRTVACLELLILTAPLPVAAKSESELLNAFFKEVHEAAVARWPEWQTNLGLKDRLWSLERPQRGQADR